MPYSVWCLQVLCKPQPGYSVSELERTSLLSCSHSVSCTASEIDNDDVQGTQRLTRRKPSVVLHLRLMIVGSHSKLTGVTYTPGNIETQGERNKQTTETPAEAKSLGRLRKAAERLAAHPHVAIQQRLQ